MGAKVARPKWKIKRRRRKKKGPCQTRWQRLFRTLVYWSELRILAGQFRSAQNIRAEYLSKISCAPRPFSRDDKDQSICCRTSIDPRLTLIAIPIVLPLLCKYAKRVAASEIATHFHEMLSRFPFPTYQNGLKNNRFYSTFKRYFYSINNRQKGLTWYHNLSKDGIVKLKVKKHQSVVKNNE